jgi:preprotein translocase subunit SecF
MASESQALKSFGRYEFRELLGRGGMGEVFRAYDSETDRIVAVKVLPTHLAEDQEFQRRFRREARTAAGLNDPHVVPIHSYGEIDGQLYVDMRLIEGRDLATLISEEGGRLSPARAVGVIEQVASALDTAHEAGLVHRDVKPSNILMTLRDFAYLIDFGIARAAADTSMTSTGHTVGTFAYMAPERLSGTADAASDVYSLACVLFECLTGERPYPGDSLEQQFAGHLTGELPRPSSVCPDVPEGFDAVIARGMAKDPDDRYPTASELAEAARAALTGSSSKKATSAPPKEVTQKASNPKVSKQALTQPSKDGPVEPDEAATARAPAVEITESTAVAPKVASRQPSTALPHHSFLSRLYTGTGAFEVVGRRKLWYGISGAIVAVAILSIIFRQFTFGIDFKGGTTVSMPAAGATGTVQVAQVSDVFKKVIGSDPESVVIVGSGSSATVQIRSEHLSNDQTAKLRNALFDAFAPKGTDGKPSKAAISDSAVSETWGGQITKKALIALAVFLVLVSLYIMVRYERYMAISALTTMCFDLTVTAGVYSLVGFEVTPATVIGLLTILGFSLYDTVIVFDKVEENTHGFEHTARRTFAEQANLAINQTFMRSINTSLISVLPVLALMVVAVWLLGVGTLKDLALVMLVGIIVGTYSSIFFATPLLVTLRERTELVRTHTRRVVRRRSPGARAGADGNAGDAVKESTGDESPQEGAGDGAGDSTKAAAQPTAGSAKAAPTKPAPGARPVRPTGSKRPSGKRNAGRR